MCEITKILSDTQRIRPIFHWEALGACKNVENMRPVRVENSIDQEKILFSLSQTVSDKKVAPNNHMKGERRLHSVHEHMIILSRTHFPRLGEAYLIVIRQERRLYELYRLRWNESETVFIFFRSGTLQQWSTKKMEGWMTEHRINYRLASWVGFSTVQVEMFFVIFLYAFPKNIIVCFVQSSKIRTFANCIKTDTFLR